MTKDDKRGKKIKTKFKQNWHIRLHLQNSWCSSPPLEFSPPTHRTQHHPSRKFSFGMGQALGVGSGIVLLFFGISVFPVRVKELWNRTLLSCEIIARSHSQELWNDDTITCADLWNVHAITSQLLRPGRGELLKQQCPVSTCVITTNRWLLSLKWHQVSPLCRPLSSSINLCYHH